jgi:ABC-type transport system involved in multi-copper enzyme maturation permease subunit
MAFPANDWPGFRRIQAVAWFTLNQALRMRLAWLGAAAAGLLMLGGTWLRDLDFGGAGAKFVVDFGLGAIGLLGTLLAALASAQLYFEDLEHGHLACLVTRPLRRWEYLAGKFCGLAALLALFVSALTLVLAGLVAWQLPDIDGTKLSIFGQAAALLWLKFTLVAMMTLVVATYAGSALFASSAGLLLTLLGQLRPFTGTAGWRAWLRLWPDLSLFDVDRLLSGGQLSGPVLAGLGAYWAACVTVGGVVAAWIFRHREF